MAVMTTLPLLAGHSLLCPRCERYHDILAYTPMETPETYVELLVPVISCPSCKWKFALGPMWEELRISRSSDADLDR